MQTLIDPFELAGPLSPASPPAMRARESRMTLLDVEEIEWEDTHHGGGPASRGMRIWLSED